MSKLLRQRWGLSRPPDVPFEINLASPQADGLLAWWPTLASHGATNLREMIQGFDGTSLGTVPWTTNPEGGPVLSFSADHANRVSAGDKPDFTRDEFAVLTWLRWGGTLEGSWAVPFSKGSYDAGEFAALLNASSIRLYLNSTLVVDWTFAVPTTGWHLLGALYSRADSYAAIWWDGTEGLSANYNQAIVDSVEPFVLGAPRPAMGSWGWDGVIGDTRFLNYRPSVSLMWQLYDPATRWELIKPRVRRWLGYVSAAAAILPLDEAMLTGGLQPLSGGLS